MEPILSNPYFPSLLRTWKFFTTYYEYLRLPEAFSQISLYQFHEHINHEQFQTNFTSQLIKALVRKVGVSDKSKRRTILSLARENKYDFFEELLESSAYEFGLAEVSFALAWRDLPEIPSDKPFEQLPIEKKYTYLSILTDLVTTNPIFKQTYMESVRTDYKAATEAKAQTILQIQKNFIPKLYNSLFLGKDSKANCYFYTSKIGDSILQWDLKTKNWRRIQGQENIKAQIIQGIMEHQDKINNQQVDLLENISDLWPRLAWNIKYTAFQRVDKLFDIKEKASKSNKMNILKKKMHQLDDQYTKFISDCFNYRWASKQRRIEYHQEIDKAETIEELVICFSKFFHETRHSSQKKLQTLEYYDTSLETKDQKPDQFKSVFLHGNYLYTKPTILTGKNSESLYSHIKSFLDQFTNFKTYFFQHLMIFLNSMIGIINQLYPGSYQRRLKAIEKLEQEIKSKQLKDEQENKINANPFKKQSKLRKINSKNTDAQNSSNDSNQYSDNQQDSQTTAEQRKKPQRGRRLREKARINYKINSNSNPKKIQLKTKQSKKVVQPIRKQPTRNPKGYKKKMNLDSDTQSQGVSLQLSDNQSSDTPSQLQKSNGLNLDKYKYEDSSPKMPLSRTLRSSTSKERK